MSVFSLVLFSLFLCFIQLPQLRFIHFAAVNRESNSFLVLDLTLHLLGGPGGGWLVKAEKVGSSDA